MKELASDMTKKELKKKIVEMLTELKWGKMSNKDKNRITTTCGNAFAGINPCCIYCPACNCHKEIEEFADKILEEIGKERFHEGWNSCEKFYEIKPIKSA